MLKSQIPFTGGGLEEPTFNAESRNAKIQNTISGGVGGVSISSFWCWVQICLNLKKNLQGVLLKIF